MSVTLPCVVLRISFACSLARVVCSVLGHASRARHADQQCPPLRPDNRAQNKCTSHDNSFTGPTARAPQTAHSRVIPETLGCLACSHARTRAVENTSVYTTPLQRALTKLHSMINSSEHPYIAIQYRLVQSPSCRDKLTHPRRLRRRCASSLASHYRWCCCGRQVRTGTQQNRCRDPRKPKPRQQPSHLIPGNGT